MGWDGRCDECGKPAKHRSPMYDLCDKCMDDETDIDPRDLGEDASWIHDSDMESG